MGFTIGTYIAIAAVLLFYLRLIILQRQKSKQSSVKTSTKMGKKSGKTAAATHNALRPGLFDANKALVMPGVALILLGALLAYLTGLQPMIREAWWLPVTGGILLLGLGIR